MALGQSIDMSIVNQSVDVSVINDMHQQKTGALLNCAVKLGALISSKCNASDTQILDLFSRSIGLAYQIQDDVLDVLVHEDMLGKKQNSDKENRKPTYPSLMGLDESQQAFVKLYEDAINSLEKLSVNADQLVLFTNQLRLREF
jgi:geranylgeranyl pyrophosphate synthase